MLVVSALTETGQNDNQISKSMYFRERGCLLSSWYTLPRAWLVVTPWWKLLERKAKSIYQVYLSCEVDHSCRNSPLQPAHPAHDTCASIARAAECHKARKSVTSLGESTRVLFSTVLRSRVLFIGGAMRRTSRLPPWVIAQGSCFHLGVVSVRERLVSRGEVSLIHAVLGGYGVLPAVLHVDHGSACQQRKEKKKKKKESEVSLN